MTPALTALAILITLAAFFAPANWRTARAEIRDAQARHDRAEQLRGGVDAFHHSSEIARG